MHTLEERIQRLETSCRRWRLLTFVAVGLTVAHFAMRVPLEAQVDATPKTLREGTVICTSLMITKNPEENPDGNAFNGYFGMWNSGVKLLLSSDKGEIAMSSGIGPDATLQIEQEREELLLSADQLMFKQKDRNAAELRKQLRELFVQRNDRLNSGKGVDGIDKRGEELQREYNESVHEVVRLGMSKTRGGWLDLNNPLGTTVVNACSNEKNSGQLSIHDANGETRYAFPRP